MYIHVYIYVYVYACIYIYTSMYVHTNMYTYIHLYKYMCDCHFCSRPSAVPFEVDLSNKVSMWHTSGASSSDSSKGQPPFPPPPPPCRIAGDDINDAKWPWQPLPPSEVKGRHRDIGDIWACCTEDMGWKTLRGLALIAGNTLGEINWRQCLKQVWKSDMEEGIRERGGVVDWQGEAMHLETWHKILVACDVDTVTGLHRYVKAWGESDPVVLCWMQGSEACQKPTADIGGWLGD